MGGSGTSSELGAGIVAAVVAAAVAAVAVGLAVAAETVPAAGSMAVVAGILDGKAPADPSKPS